MKNNANKTLALFVGISLLGLCANSYAQEVQRAPLQAKVRAGIHETFERVVFDWPQPVTFSLTQNGQEVRLHFTSAQPVSFSDIDLSQIARRHLARITHYEQVSDATGITVVMQLDKHIVAKPVLQNRLVILDLKEGVAPLLAQEPIKSPQATLIAAEGPASTAPLQEAPKVETPKIEPPAIEAPMTGAPAAAAVPVPEEAKPQEAPKPEAAKEEADKKEPEINPLLSNDNTINAAALNQIETKNYIAPNLDDLGAEPIPLLILNPGLVTGIAVYRRADFIYLVFDKKLSLPLAEMQKGTPRVMVETLDAIGGSAYRFYMPQEASLRVEREESSWVILATKKLRSAPISLTLSPQPDYALGARILIPVSRAGDPVRFYDPEVGDLLLVMPLATSGQAIRQPYQYADLQFIPSEQGVVIHPRVDGVEMKRQTTGIEISASQGLRLSSEKDTGIISGDEKTSSSGSRLFNFGAWYGPKSISYTDMRQRWQRALAEVNINERDRVRLDMARFYFARNHGHECLGLLNLLAQQIPDLERRSEFLALRGAARILARDPDGPDDFKNVELINHPEIKLWQAIAKTKLMKWKEATELFIQADTILENYPEPFFTDFSILAVEAAIADENRVFAANVLDRLVQRRPELDEVSQAVAYLRGVLMSLGGHLDRAELLWKKALNGKERLYQVRAQLLLTDLAVLKGKLAPTKAAEKLERLRYAWRGDDLELDILRRIGKFYIEAGKIEEGLSALKMVLAFLPESQAAADLRQEMAYVFRDVFLGDNSDKISPLDALSLYERFYELAPAGDEGDAIIRSLAERMVAVDLLDRAAGLLADQARRRLTGTFKARVGTQATGIFLLDRKAEAALEILKDTDIPDMPEDLTQERNLLKAKAFSMLERNEEALELLQKSNDEYARRLKADIAWRKRDWVNAAIGLDDLIGPPPQYGDPINAEKAQLVINRAIAFAMATDNGGLEKLRVGFGEVMKATPQAGLFKVLTEPETGLPSDQGAMKSFMADVDLFQDYLENYRSLK